MHTPKTVFFDLGIVLSSSGDVFTGLTNRLHVTVPQLLEVYWDDRDAYDRGLAIDTYWGNIQERLGGRTAPNRDLAWLDQEIWAKIRPDAEALVQDVKKTGRTTGLLSNAPLPMVEIAPKQPWAKYLDHILISAALGCAKPDPTIYQIAEEHSQTTGTQIAFIDDRPENVAAAQARGWQAHLWISDADSRHWLDSIGALTPTTH